MLDSSTQYHSTSKPSQHNRNFQKANPNKEHIMEIEDSFPYQTTDISLTTISNKETIPTKVDEVTEFQFGDECYSNKENVSRFANQNKLKMEDINIATNCNDMSTDIILFGDECEGNGMSNESVFNSSKGNRCSCMKYSDLLLRRRESNDSLLGSAVKNLYRDDMVVKEVTPFSCYDSPMIMNQSYHVPKNLDWDLNDIKIPSIPTRKISNKKQKERSCMKYNYYC